MSMGRRIYVPMPTAQTYHGTRDSLVQKYGEASVTRAETAVIINVMEAMGVIKHSEFVDYMVQILEKTEQRRQEQAAGGR